MTNSNELRMFMKYSMLSCANLSFFENNFYEFDLKPSFAYFFQLWGASGGISSYSTYTPCIPGLGSYVSGLLIPHERTPLVLTIGGEGETVHQSRTGGKGGYNGGTDGAIDSCTHDASSGGSGGSTDLRLIRADESSSPEERLQSLRSRVMVAAGGGSCGCCFDSIGKGGNGGTIRGEPGGIGSPNRLKLNGGEGGNPETPFGQGTQGTNGNEAGGSGGGGYFGGKGGLGIICTYAYEGASGGGGGSSYISGYSGCSTVAYNGSILNSEFHPSGLVFTNGTMIGGSQTMPDGNGSEAIGHQGNGKAVIFQIPLPTDLFSSSQKRRFSFRVAMFPIYFRAL